VKGRTIWLWDTLTGARRKIPTTCENFTTTSTFSPDSTVIASAWDDWIIRPWDAATGALQEEIGINTNTGCITFSKDGRHLQTDRGELIEATTMPGVSEDFTQNRQINLSVDDEWVYMGADKCLWLPHAYGPTSVAVSGRIIVLGHSSGGLTFL
jgi:WD40 repeat protein